MSSVTFESVKPTRIRENDIFLPLNSFSSWSYQPADSLTVGLEQECHHLPLTNKTTSEAEGIEMPGAAIGLVTFFEMFLLLQLFVMLLFLKLNWTFKVRPTPRKSFVPVFETSYQFQYSETVHKLYEWGISRSGYF